MSWKNIKIIKNWIDNLITRKIRNNFLIKFWNSLLKILYIWKAKKIKTENDAYFTYLILKWIKRESSNWRNIIRNIKKSI
jgi:hypothetical protein